MANNINATTRILPEARAFIVGHFMPNENPVEKHCSNDMPLHSAMLCLYSAMLLLQVQEIFPQVHEYFSGRKNKEFDCNQRARQIRSDIYRKNQNLSQQEIDQLAEKQLETEIRNAFSHGCFKFSFDSKSQPVVVLSTNYAGANQNASITISFKEIFTTLGGHIKLQEYKVKKMLKDLNESLDLQHLDKQTFANLIKDESLDQQKIEEIKNCIFRNIALPKMLQHMTNYFVNRDYQIPEEIDKKIRNPIYSTCLEIIFMTSLIAYNQNEAYQTLSPDSLLFKKISILRNSLMHGLTNFSDGGLKVSISHGKPKYAGILDEEFDSVLLGMKMEMWSAETEIAKIDKALNFDDLSEEEQYYMKEILRSSGITKENSEDLKEIKESFLEQMGKIYEETEKIINEKADPDGDGK